MIEFDEAEMTFDASNTVNNDWETHKPCPKQDTNCGANYISRKCIYKSQGTEFLFDYLKRT
jgi:hypothetical protein